MERLKYLWFHVDAKLRFSVLTAIVAWVVAKYAITLDADTSALITGVLASIAGYAKPNDGTIIRTNQEDGNAYPPADIELKDAGNDVELAEEGEPEA